MLGWLVRKMLDSQERSLGQPVDYLRYINGIKPSMVLRFGSLLPFVNCRKTLPAEAWFAAQIVILRECDCGTCLQIAINLARKEGVHPELLQDLVEGNVAKLPDDLVDVIQFAHAVHAVSGEEEPLRERLREHYGERGLIELAYAIASAPIPPTVKRVLGYAQSCSAVPFVYNQQR